MSRMTDEDLGAICNKFEMAALNFGTTTLSAQRAAGIRAYYGKPYGDEQEGRSKVITREVFDTINWMMPMLLETFVSSGSVVEFMPQNEQDVASAKQETDAVNYIFFHDNPGFVNLYSWFQDALTQKNGVIKFACVKKQIVDNETYQGLTQEQLDILLEQLSTDDKVKREVVKHESYQDTIPAYDPMNPLVMQSIPVDLHNIEVRITKEVDKIEIYAIPPEEFFISINQNSIDLSDCQFCCHRRAIPKSELIEMGFDEEELSNLPTAQFPTFPNQQEWFARQYLQDVFLNQYIYTDESMRPILISECYLQADLDGDGIAEMVKVFTSNGQVLKKGGKSSAEAYPMSSPPFAALSPIPLAHQFFGLSIADITMDLQRIGTILNRQLLDNIYVGNNARQVVNTLAIDPAEFTVFRPGQVVRCKGPVTGNYEPLPFNDTSQSSLAMIDHIARIGEMRTGVSMNTTGLDPDMLQNNKGDASVMRMMTAAAQRINLIARIFAETGFKVLFRGVHELMRKYQNIEKMIQINGSWTPINPADWKLRDNMTVNVGLGTGNKDYVRQCLMLLGQVQKELLMGGKSGVLVDDGKVFNLWKKIADTYGIKDIQTYLVDPKSPEAQQAQQANAEAAQQAAANEPNMAAIKAEVEIAQLKYTTESEIAKQKHESDLVIAQLKNQVDEQKNQVTEMKAWLDYKIKEDALALENTQIALEEAKHISAQALESHRELRESNRELKEIMQEISASKGTEPPTPGEMTRV